MGRPRKKQRKIQRGLALTSSSACLGWTREVKNETGLPIDDRQSPTVVADNSTWSRKKALFAPSPTPS